MPFIKYKIIILPQRGWIYWQKTMIHLEKLGIITHTRTEGRNTFFKSNMNFSGYTEQDSNKLQLIWRRDIISKKAKVTPKFWIMGIIKKELYFTEQKRIQANFRRMRIILTWRMQQNESLYQVKPVIWYLCYLGYHHFK